jgi:NAD(P)H-hydrate epimerase|tara:strand:- start:121 stop:999 length:879 start_codon:yes stop_codon:yes gene_type:complete
MKPNLKTNSLTLWLHNFPWKKRKDYKYSRGKLIIFGSQLNMTGATILSSEAALRVGTGSVKIICSKKTLPIYSSKFPSSLKEEINNLNSLKKLVVKEKNSIFLIGPGAGVNQLTKKRTKLILRNSKYAIIDADALTCFKNNPKELYSLLDKNKIITPHIKEFHTIFPMIEKKITDYKKIINASKLCKCNIVLKGAKTLICSSTRKIILNKHTSSELAVIGSGDVLSGIIASLVGKNKLNPFLACCAGVWIHGDIAKKFGPGLIAEDIVKNIPNTLRKLKKIKFTRKKIMKNY